MESDRAKDEKENRSIELGSPMSDMDNLAHSFAGSVTIEKPSKRSYSDHAWEKASPIPKKLDIDETPLFNRANQEAYNEAEERSGIMMSPSSASLTSPLKTETSSIPAHISPVKSKAKEKLLVIGSVCAEHNTGVHQENSQRTGLLCGEQGCLRRPSLLDTIDWMDADELPHPPLVDLLRVHEFEYLSHLEGKTSQRSAATSSSAPCPSFYAPQGYLDTDTPLAPQSLSTAKKFCSAAIVAVDKVMQAKQNKAEGYDRVFVIGRPPGHHAGPNGCVASKTFWKNPSMTTSGFCLLNTVAVAAAYARYRYGRDNAAQAPRIAIVDIDVHHGNGTEEIVRNLSPHQTYLPLPSSWAPVSKLSYKPWLNEQDSEEVFFASVHRFEGVDFYPGCGDEGDNQEGENIVNINLTPIPPKAQDTGVKRKPRKQEELIKQASEEFRRKISSLLLPRLKTFRPHLVFISAGFDAHYDDMYHYLSEEDIHWVTRELGKVSDEAGGWGVISVLEGGYSLESDPALPTSSSTAPSNVSASNAMGLRQKGQKGSLKGSESSDSLPPNKYAIRPGDGGLVKGVLAHVTALVRKEQW